MYLKKLKKAGIGAGLCCLALFLSACGSMKDAEKSEKPGSLTRIMKTGSVGDAELEKASRPMVLNLSSALQKNDLKLFNRDLIPEICFKEERFSAVCKAFSAQNGAFVSCAYLGHLDRGNIKIVLWKFKYRLPKSETVQGDHLYVLYLGRIGNAWKIFTFQTMEKF